MQFLDLFGSASQTPVGALCCGGAVDDDLQNFQQITMKPGNRKKDSV